MSESERSPLKEVGEASGAAAPADVSVDVVAAGQPLPVATALHAPVQGVGMDGLCNCFSDLSVCCCGCWCSPCLHGMNHERAGLESGPCWKIPAVYCLGGALASTGVGVICQCVAIYWVCKGRQQIQQLAGIPADDDCGACFTTCCCFACTACQEARTVNKMWEANGRRPLLGKGMAPGPQVMQQIPMQPMQQAVAVCAAVQRLGR